MLELVGREALVIAQVNKFMEKCGCKGVQRNEKLTGAYWVKASISFLKWEKSQDAFVLMEMVQSGEHKGEVAVGGEHCWSEALRGGKDWDPVRRGGAWL